MADRNPVTLVVNLLRSFVLSTDKGDWVVTTMGAINIYVYHSNCNDSVWSGYSTN